MIKILLVCSLSVLAACVGKPVQEMSYTARRDLAGQLVKRCMDQGVKLQTAEMEQCTQQEALREVSVRNRMQARRESGAICNSVGNTVICN